MFMQNSKFFIFSEKLIKFETFTVLWFLFLRAELQAIKKKFSFLHLTSLYLMNLL